MRQPTPRQIAAARTAVEGIDLDVALTQGPDDLVAWLGPVDQIKSAAFEIEPDSLRVSIRPVDPRSGMEISDIRATGHLVVRHVEYVPGRRDERRVRLAVSLVDYDGMIESVESIAIVAENA